MTPSNDPDLSPIKPTQPAGSGSVGPLAAQPAPQAVPDPQPPVQPELPEVLPTPTTPAPAPTPSPAAQPPYAPIQAAGFANVQPSQSLPTAEPQAAMPPAAAVAAPAAADFHVYPPKKSHRRLLIASAVVVLVLLLGAGAVFGLYLPSRPENVYRTGLDRTGMAVDKLATEGLQSKQLATLEASDFSGDLKVTGPDKTYNGSFSTRYDKNQSDSTLGYKVSNGQASASADAFNVRLLSDLGSGKTYPDVYFKVTGLAGIGVDQYIPGISNYEGKWISVTSDYLEALVPAPTETEGTKSDFTAADAAALSKIAVAKTKEYVLTSDADKAVLVMKKFKGTEKMENGRKANRYEVGIHKQHAKDYCKSLITAIVADDAFKRLPGVSAENLDQNKDDAIKSCQTAIDKDLKDSDSFDMWIDTKTKLVHKVRFTDDTDKTGYLELGQSYTGGNQIPLFMNVHSDQEKYDVKLTFEVDTVANTTKGTARATYSQSGDWKIEANFIFKPYKGDVTITKPQDAIPIQVVLEKFGISPDQTSALSAAANSTTSTAAKADDVERQTDLKAIQGQLEAYYAQHGFYPTLDQLNSTTWRAANIKGLTNAALTDPNASGTPAMTSKPVLGNYGYVTSKCTSGASNCKAYVLTAVLSTGKEYVLNSLM